MNIGQDAYAWLWVVKAAILLGLIAWMIPDIIYLVQRKVNREKKVRNLCIKIIATCIAALALFVFFGPGEKPPDVDVAEDGHRKSVEARPEPPAEKPEAKKDPYLKAVDDGPEADRKAADEYLKKAIERNKT
jgi:hypothetical protein